MAVEFRLKTTDLANRIGQCDLKETVRACVYVSICKRLALCLHQCAAPLSTERHWTAEPERFHSTEVSDEQVGIQQLQLGGQLTPTVGPHPLRQRQKLK